MRVDEETSGLIEWGKEEKQPDFVEFIEFIRDRYADKQPIVVKKNGVENELVLFNIILSFKKPFPDFDVILQYFVDEKKKKLSSFRWEYTYMDRFKKAADNTFCITDENGEETIIRLK